MMESPQSQDPKKADPLADALERLERSVANREKARISSLVDSGCVRFIGNLLPRAVTEPLNKPSTG